MGAEPIDPLVVPIPTGGPLGILGPGGIAGVAGALVMFDPRNLEAEIPNAKPIRKHPQQKKPLDLVGIEWPQSGW